MTENKSAIVVIAPGTEEMEAVIVIDVLRRADIDVELAGLRGPDAVRCSRGVMLQPDSALDALGDADADALVLPGGRDGAEAFAQSAAVGERLRRRESDAMLTGVICAGPIALVAHGVFSGKRMTSHPSVREQVQEHGVWVDEAVVRDGVLTTSQGPGTAFAFALSLVEQLTDRATRERVAAPMMLKA